VGDFMVRFVYRDTSLIWTIKVKDCLLLHSHNKASIFPTTF
jgi:hypothetical protein